MSGKWALNLGLKYYNSVNSILLVDDLEFVSFVKAQVTFAVGFKAVYGHDNVVCKRNIVCFI